MLHFRNLPRGKWQHIGMQLAGVEKGNIEFKALAATGARHLGDVRVMDFADLLRDGYYRLKLGCPDDDGVYDKGGGAVSGLVNVASGSVGRLVRCWQEVAENAPMP